MESRQVGLIGGACLYVGVMSMLYCPHGHKWSAPANLAPNDRALYGECPECGEPVAIGCSIVHNNLLRVLVALILILVPPLRWGIAVWAWQVEHRLESNHEVTYLATVILGVVFYWVAIHCYFSRRERLGMRTAANLMNLSHVAATDAAKEFGNFPLFSVVTTEFGGKATCETMFTGEFRGEQVAVMSVTFPLGKRIVTQSVVASTAADGGQR